MSETNVTKSKSRLPFIGGVILVLLLVAVLVATLTRSGDDQASPAPTTTTTESNNPIDQGLDELQAAIASSEQALEQARGAQGQVSKARTDAQRSVTEGADSLRGISSSDEGRAIAEGTFDELKGAAASAQGGLSALDGAQSAATAARANVDRLTSRLSINQGPAAQDAVRRAQDQVSTTQQQLEAIQASVRDDNGAIQKLLDQAEALLSRER